VYATKPLCIATHYQAAEFNFSGIQDDIIWNRKNYITDVRIWRFC